MTGPLCLARPSPCPPCDGRHKTVNTTPQPPFEKLTNFRDIGGHPMRTGLVFRSGDLSQITPRDLAQLESFQIRLICDLRVPRESRKRPPRLPWNTPVKTVNISLHSEATHRDIKRKMLRFLFRSPATANCPDFIRDYYQHLAFERTTQIREVITKLTQPGSLPALIHCTAGKDRTGVIVAILQLLAGVPYERVMADYLETNQHFEPRLRKAIRVIRILTLFQVPEQRMRQVLLAHPEALDAVHDDILTRYGSTENYLTEACQIEPATLNQLKQILTAKPAALKTRDVPS